MTMSWAARVFSGLGLSGLGLSDLVLSGIGPLSCLGPGVAVGPGVGVGSGVGVRPGVGLGADGPRGRLGPRSVAAAVLAGVLAAGGGRAVHDAAVGDAMEASTRRMSRTVRTVPPTVPVPFDFPVRG